MDDLEIKKALDTYGATIDKAMEKYDGQLAEKGKVDQEIRDEVRVLSEKFESAVTEIAQKMETAKTSNIITMSAGEEFVKSEQFKALLAGNLHRARLEVKNTVIANNTTTFPQQNPGVIPGDFVPKTIRNALRTIPVSSNLVNSLREEAWNNSASGVLQGGAKPESDITFEQYNVPVETIAHWIKVSNQLLADAPAIVAYIDSRARDGLAEEIDRQLLLGNGVAPTLSGLTDTGNFTAYSAVSDDLVVDAINRAKYQLWAIGNMPDTVILNPADWGAMERTREGANQGMYLYGIPGTNANQNPFGVSVVLSNFMPAGNFLIGALQRSAVVYARSGATVEMGYVNDDFTRNLVTIRVEERLGLGVERPTGILIRCVYRLVIKRRGALPLFF
jgi:HK97 family phage major capsid protein